MLNAVWMLVPLLLLLQPTALHWKLRAGAMAMVSPWVCIASHVASVAHWSNYKPGGLAQRIDVLLAGALFVLHVVGKWLNPTHVFLVPGTTMVIPFQLITCGLFDDSLPNLLLGVPVLVYTGSILHARWGAVELARFLAVANVLMACLSWLSMIVLYVLFRDEHFLFARLGGVSGALGALAVALRQQALRAPPPPAGVQV